MLVINSQNLNLGIRDAGWVFDFAKFYTFLVDRYRAELVYLFIGQRDQNPALYAYLEKIGYVMAFKPTQNYLKDAKLTTKGNVDVELVLYAAAKVYADYDEAIIVSGDGDFCCLYEHLREQNKLCKILIPNKFKYSKLIKPYLGQVDFVSTKRRKLEKKQKTGIVPKNASSR